MVRKEANDFHYTSQKQNKTEQKTTIKLLYVPDILLFLKTSVK